MISHYVLTYSGIHYPVTYDQFVVIANLRDGDKVELAGNIIFKKNISDIATVEKYEEAFPNKFTRGAHQPYWNEEREGLSWEEIKKLPGGGFNEVFNKAKYLSHLKALGRGLLAAQEKIRNGNYKISTPQIDKFLATVEARIAKFETAEYIKNN